MIQKELTDKYPNKVFFETAKRESDSEFFKVGDIVITSSGRKETILAFDEYDYPLPIDLESLPIAKFCSDVTLTIVFEGKTKKVIRAIVGSIFYHYFEPIEGYGFLDSSRVEKLRKVN